MMDTDAPQAEAGPAAPPFYRPVPEGLECSGCRCVTLFKRGMMHAPGCPAVQGFRGLTEREREVCLMISRGLTCKDIAHDLRMSVKTVECHRYNSYRKLGVHHTGTLTRLAVEWEREEIAAGRKPKRYRGEPIPGAPA
jgi:DNA-binding CsgD family transcriptional regulator